jgi:hypothetical protein
LWLYNQCFKEVSYSEMFFPTPRSPNLVKVHADVVLG